MNFITIHFGSRAPKRYYNPVELAERGLPQTKDGTLHHQQPEGVKCRLKMRFEEGTTVSDMLPHIREHWFRQDHSTEPAWVASDTEGVAEAISVLTGAAVREWNPEEGDE